HGETGARGHLVPVGDLHHEGAELPHLLLQEPNRRLERPVPERVGAHQLAEAIRGVRRGPAPRPHLEQVDADPGAGELPPGLTAGEPAADDGDALALAHVDARRARPAPAARVGGPTTFAAAFLRPRLAAGSAALAGAPSCSRLRPRT